jgi:hypothetical protein
VAVGATSDSSELESPALMMSSPSLSPPRLRFLDFRDPFEAFLRERGPGVAFCGMPPGTFAVFGANETRGGLGISPVGCGWNVGCIRDGDGTTGALGIRAVGCDGNVDCI